jgi:hypothetical protein
MKHVILPIILLVLTWLSGYDFDHRDEGVAIWAGICVAVVCMVEMEFASARKKKGLPRRVAQSISQQQREEDPPSPREPEALRRLGSRTDRHSRSLGEQA